MTASTSRTTRTSRERRSSQSRSSQSRSSQSRSSNGAHPHGRRLLDAARTMVEADGPEGLSMRRLAAKVGVAPTAIYWHLGNREQVLHSLLDEMLADLPPVVARGRTPRSRVASLARAIHRQNLASMSATRLARYLGRSGELYFPPQAELARELAKAGIQGDEAARAVRAIMFVVGGFLLLEDSYERRGAVPGAVGELWRTFDDPAIDDRLRRAMSEPVLPAGMLDYTIDRLLASIIP